ncbi:hypothetical protein BKA63DRAFT_497472 [Paraphoma chrysanthemicola]|nr:hypothetical protein BKA63DRAFT_497472 [Paraphoma chrysanthemicola]
MSAERDSRQRTPSTNRRTPRAPQRLQLTSTLDSSKIDLAERSSLFQSAEPSSVEEPLYLNGADHWVHPSCKVVGREYTPEEKFFKKHMVMILAVDPCVSEKIAIVGYDSEDIQRAAHALHAYTANINVSCFRIRECPADIIKAAGGPWDKILCQPPDWTDLEPWLVACRPILAPQGHVIIELEWDSQICWRIVAWECARLSWRRGLKLDRVNGCNATANRLSESRINQKIRRHISRCFHSLANALLCIDSAKYKALANELRTAATRMIQEAEEASGDEEDNILEEDSYVTY